MAYGLCLNKAVFSFNKKKVMIPHLKLYSSIPTKLLFLQFATITVTPLKPETVSLIFGHSTL